MICQHFLLQKSLDRFEIINSIRTEPRVQKITTRQLTLKRSLERKSFEANSGRRMQDFCYPNIRIER